MVVAMITMWVVQMAINQIVHMISMRHCFVATTRTMHMGSIVAAAPMVWCTLIRIGRRCLDDVFVDVVAVHVMEVAVVEVVNMAVVANRGVTASRSMDVRVILMPGI